MEFLQGGIAESLKGKCVLVTGSTGFLAKLFVEKVLREQPDVKKLYLLLRAADEKSAAQRLQKQVVGKQVFNVLREKHGVSFESFISAKLQPVAGDIIYDGLGVKDPNLAEEMLTEVNAVVNMAATTTFDERYDVAIDINLLGPKHVLQFAKKCSKLELFLHVSTAYVAGYKGGLVLERKFGFGETLNGKKLDIDAEVRLVDETLANLQSDVTSTEKKERSAMKELGLTRAKYFGWPNTYVFTKAMGEMLLEDMRGDIPLVIVRPSIITSTYKEPIPGWMEGTRTIDSLIVGYVKGKLNCFLGDLDLTMDVVPGDMVVSAMITAMAAHSNQPSEHIYHVTSSMRNPVTFRTFSDTAYRYFRNNPRVDKDGKKLMIEGRKLPIFSTMSSFRAYMTLRYRLPLELLRLASIVLCGLFAERYEELSRKYRFVMHLVDLYEPYAFFKGCFDDINLERLRRSVAEGGADEKGVFGFDLKSVDWDHYFHDVHIPGILKYVCR